MRLGTISLWGGNLDAFRREVGTADALGFDLVTAGDSPIGYRDLYVSLTLMALETRQATIAPMITSPHLRHPVANATAISSLHDLTGGRVAFALGAGASISLGLGLKQPKEQVMRDYLCTMRSLLNGESAKWDGGIIQPLRCARPVPIYYSAWGPKAMRIAGELADGVVIEVGSDLEQVRRNVNAVRDAARSVGRDPGKVDIWATSYISVGDSRSEALHKISALIAATAPQLGMIKGAMELVPAEYKARILEAQRRYSFAEHALAGGSNSRMIVELDLLEFLSQRNAIAGNPAQIREQIGQLEAEGISCLLAPLAGSSEPVELMEQFRDAARGQPRSAHLRR
jgi:5,10-methylenetetrahydromethanopterin reductase